MKRERLMTVLIGPHVSEKGTRVADRHNQIVFRVRPDANKKEIKQAVELMFEVEVDHVRVQNHLGKQKRFSGVVGRRPKWKKAFVQLKEGQDIDFLAAE